MNDETDPPDLPATISAALPRRAARIAQLILQGFDRHYALFRASARQAKSAFERGDWRHIQQLARDRIAFYDQRVQESVDALQATFRSERLADLNWQSVKTHYIILLAEHRQPELAETFYNSVITRILHRDYFHNQFLFVRPAVSTEYVEADPVSYRSYYPLTTGLRRALRQVFDDLALSCPFENLERDIRRLIRRARQAFARPLNIDQDCQVQVLSSLFFRNKGAYLIGRLVNGNSPVPFAVPILRRADGSLFVDTVLFDGQHIALLFSFTRAYFLVDMDVPAAYVQFLRTLLPNKPKAEMYTALGLQKQGKTLFYRDFLHHLRHSHDLFTIAPGIRGLVMMVFTLPSYPYVFKLIKDIIAPSKDIDRAGVVHKYQMVKEHDRVGRMADTWEYSQVALPLERFAPGLLAELRNSCASSLEIESGTLILRHLYIERRMTPLNIYLQQANDAELEHGIVEYGNAIRQLAAANIFPGDMLYKNFGVTRLGRVVFYDYDEIEYMTDCRFRDIPPAPNPEAELSAEPWYSVAPNDVFPEQFGPFLLGNDRIRRYLLQHHADLLTCAFWRDRQQAVLDGYVEDISPYPESIRFG